MESLIFHTEMVKTSCAKEAWHEKEVAVHYCRIPGDEEHFTVHSNGCDDADGGEVCLKCFHRAEKTISDKLG